ncbi:MAG: acylphosphatase [Sulfurovum sp.]|nr:acylphosphatase [Sulfurovum sp.]MCB4754468.1 acylphosphatase [Sulfurovum sp.]MCB4761379.1 acylphosphatase [Sulfurovum sp.]
MEWYRFISIGKVQGVFYRKSVSQAMMRAGFNGYIQNLNDGTVETVAFIVDEDTDFPCVLQILKEGSPTSDVEDIHYESIGDVEVESDGFVIR